MKKNKNFFFIFTAIITMALPVLSGCSLVAGSNMPFISSADDFKGVQPKVYNMNPKEDPRFSINLKNKKYKKFKHSFEAMTSSEELLKEYCRDGESIYIASPIDGVYKFTLFTDKDRL